ncbi:MAG: RHS domain-containing protein [Aquimonas sp.]|nr:RHS domain-containing protein [Aquimonas sp.]
MGRRVYKETATETTWFVYADEGLVAELQADGTLKRAYGWKPQGLWGTDPLWLADRSLSGEWVAHVYHNDHLWTPQRLTGLNGAVTWSGRSEAFGLTVAVVDSVENPLRFPGQYFDEASGFHYNFHRDYSPSSGRYVEIDPIGLAGGMNIYVYSFANSIFLFDELGLRPRPNWWYLLCEASNAAGDAVNRRRRLDREKCQKIYDEFKEVIDRSCRLSRENCGYLAGGDNSCWKDCANRVSERCRIERENNRKRLDDCLDRIPRDWPLSTPDCGKPFS